MSARSAKKRKKRKHKNLILDGLVYILMRLLIVVLNLFPVEWDLRLARALGRLLWRCYKRGRRRALENLRVSYPEKEEAWILQTARHSFEHIAMLGVDVLLTPKLVRKDNWQQYATFKHVERPKWLMQEGKGLLLVTGHYGNFELLGYLMSLFDFNIYSVARPLDNRFVDRYIRSIRQRQGQKIIDKKGASDLMSLANTHGASLGLIADQDAGRKGIFVDFFGRKASTFKSIALLAVTRDQPIVVGYCRRMDNRFFFEIGMKRIIFPEEWKDKENPMEWITAEYTKAIEAFIREDPTQYWWVHRRWKTQPRSKAP
jgi:KDO2-lipid IV(A) lauroyltransferase